MNWVGGVRCRVNCSSKRNRKIQKEYFEKKRLDMHRSTQGQKRESQTQQVKVSQDILPFRNKSNPTAEVSASNVVRPNHRVIDLGSKRSKSKIGGLRQEIDFKFQTVELPASPLETPSILELSQSPINKASSLRTMKKQSATVRREGSSTNNSLFTGQCKSQRRIGLSSSNISLFGQEVRTRKNFTAHTKYEHLVKDSKSVLDMGNENIFGKIACSSNMLPDVTRQSVAQTCENSSVVSSNRHSRVIEQDNKWKFTRAAKQNKHTSEMEDNTGCKYESACGNLLEQRNLCEMDDCHNSTFKIGHGSHNLEFLHDKENFIPHEQINFESNCDSDTFQMLPQKKCVKSDNLSYLNLTCIADESTWRNIKRFNSINEHDRCADEMSCWGPISHVNEMDCKEHSIQSRHPSISDDFQVPAVQSTVDFDNEVIHLNEDYHDMKPYSLNDNLPISTVNWRREAPLCIKPLGPSKFVMNETASSELQDCSEMVVHNDENHVGNFRLNFEKTVFPWETEDNIHTVSDMADYNFFEATDVHDTHPWDVSTFNSNSQEVTNVQRSLKHLSPMNFCSSKVFENCHHHLQTFSPPFSECRNNEMDVLKSDSRLVHCERMNRRKYEGGHSVSSGIQFTSDLDIVNSSENSNMNSCEIKRYEADNKQRKCGSIHVKTGVTPESWCPQTNENISLFSAPASIGKSPTSGAAFPVASTEVCDDTELHSCQTETAVAKRKTNHSMTPKNVSNSVSSPMNCGIGDATQSRKNPNMKIRDNYIKNKSLNTKNEGKEDLSQLISEMNDSQRQASLQMSCGVKDDTKSAENNEMKKEIAGVLMDMVEKVASCTRKTSAASSKNILVSTATQTEQLVILADAACSPILSRQPSNICSNAGCRELNYTSGYSLRSRKNQE